MLNINSKKKKKESMQLMSDIINAVLSYTPKYILE